MKDRLILDIPDKGCVVWFEEFEGRPCLSGCERSDFYSAGGVDKADAEYLSFDLTAPEDQSFLDRINVAFGTNLKFEDFAGR